MRIIHRLAIPDQYWALFEKHAVDFFPRTVERVEVAGCNIIHVNESTREWPEIRKLVAKLQILDIPETEFSKTELENSGNLVFRSTSFQGFPQPSDDFGFKKITFDDLTYCGNCGKGLRQVAPFRIKSVPRWGKRQTFQLHWVFDEIFVTQECYDEVFKPFGVDNWPVHSRDGKRILENVVQIRIESVVDLKVPDHIPFKMCGVCSVKKYSEQFTGFWPAPVVSQEHIFKSTQYFGYGHEASKALFVSQNLFRSMQSHGLNCKYWATRDDMV